MTSATRLRYESIYGADAQRVMRNTDDRFTDLHSFLTTVKRYVSHPDRAPRAVWRPVDERRPQRPNEPLWVEIVDADAPDDESDVVEEFMTDTLRVVYDEPDDPADPWPYGNRIRVLDRDPKLGCLHLERSPSTARICARPNTYVLERQIQAVRQLQNAPLPSHAPLHRLLDDRDDDLWPPVLREPWDDLPWAFLTDADRPGADDQRRFVALGLRSPDFAMLEGPPGSGKTTAICELITQLVRDGRRVLLCASTHVAVDNVLERLDTRADELGVIAVRIGDRSRCSESVHHLRLEDRAATERARLLAHLERTDAPSFAQDALAEMLRRDGGDAVTRLVLDTANVVCGTTIGILQHPDIKESRDALSEDRLFDVLIIDEASKTTFQEMLVPAVLAKRWVLVGDYRQLSPTDDKGPAAALAQAMAGHELQAQIGLDLLRLFRHDPLPSRTGSGTVAMRGIAVVDDAGGEWWQEYESRARLVGLPIHTGHDLRDAHSTGGLVLVTSAAELKSAELFAPTGWTIRSPRNGTEPDVVAEWAHEAGWRVSTLYQLRLSDQKEQTRLDNELARLHPDHRDALADTVERAMERVKGLALPSVLECLQRGANRARHHAATALSDGLPPVCFRQRHVLLRHQHRMHPDISRLPRELFYAGEALQDPAGIRTARSWDYRRYSARVTWVDVRSDARQAAESSKRSRRTKRCARSRPSHSGRRGPAPRGRSASSASTASRSGCCAHGSSGCAVNGGCDARSSSARACSRSRSGRSTRSKGRKQT